MVNLVHHQGPCIIFRFLSRSYLGLGAIYFQGEQQQQKTYIHGYRDRSHLHLGDFKAPLRKDDYWFTLDHLFLDTSAEK